MQEPKSSLQISIGIVICLHPNIVTAGSSQFSTPARNKLSKGILPENLQQWKKEIQ